VTDKRFPVGAEEYYYIESAIKFFESPVPDNHERWRCVLCGWGLDVHKSVGTAAGACGCGGCGMTCLRPIAEFPFEALDRKGA